MERHPTPCSTAARLAATLAIAAFLVAAPPAIRGARAVQDDPPFPPARALATFRVADGFRIELFAAEPLVTSPVAMEVDEDGRVFVVEMPGYPLDVGGSGRIKLLEDSDGDGLPDRSTTFAEGLRLPTGIMKWKKGVLVTDSPQVWYLEDGDGDGRAEIKREILTGFALTNPQHTTNSPVYGLDNWIYLANEGPVRTVRYRDVFGDAGGEVHFPGRADSPRLPPDADGRNVRFRPDTTELETLASRSQFGQTFDAWGHQLLVTHNRHAIHEVMAARYLSRNPALVVPSAIEHIPDYPLPAALFPITRRPEFQLLTDVGVMTAASGLTWYLADLFPPAYRDAIFVADGAHNLVHAASVREHGVTFRASRMFDGREFLASTDAWFRPVNLHLGPEGALYVVDYYRKVLEHPEWTDEATAASPDLYAGRDRGRIYRVVPAGAPRPAWAGRVALGRAALPELVAALNAPNIWWRRHAQRLLVDRREAAAIAPLTTLALSGPFAPGRVHALWTLDALGAEMGSTLEHALQDGSPGVRENAIRIAELHLARRPALAGALLRLAEDPDPKVRFQLLLTLGDISTPEAAAVRDRLLWGDIEDAWMRTAALSARDVDPAALIAEALKRPAARESTGGRALFSQLGAMTGASGRTDRIRRVVAQALDTGGTSSWPRDALLEGLATGLRGSNRRDPALDPERARLAKHLLEGSLGPLRRSALGLLEALGLPPQGAEALRRHATTVVTSSGSDPEARADAIRVLALADVTRSGPMLRAVLSMPNPAVVQIAAVRALAEPPGDDVAGLFLELWDRWTPAVRDEAVRAMVRTPGRVRRLVDALEAGSVKVSEIEWPLRVRMMMVDDMDLRARARKLLSAKAGAARAAMERYRGIESREADSRRGREVFDRTCAACHRYRGSGGADFGPDLGEVRGRLPQALLADVVQPNLSIADGYELWIAELTDGGTVSGTIGAETAAALTFRQPGGGEVTVARARISGLRIAPLSGMPEGLDAQLALQDMADLLAFIRGDQ